MKSLSTLKTRLLSFFLAVVMLLSSSIPSYAMSSNAGGTSGSGVATGGNGDFGCNINTSDPSLSAGRIGIRLSLVDYDNPSKVISIDSSGNPMVLDLLYTSFDKWIYYAVSGTYFTAVDTNNTMYSTVKTQDQLLTPANGGPKIKQYYFNQSFDCSDGSTIALSDMQPWMIHDGSYNRRGEEFVNWCMSDEYGNLVLTSGNLSSTLTTITIDGTKAIVNTVVNKDTGSVTTEVETALGKTSQKFDRDIRTEALSALYKIESFITILSSWEYTPGSYTSSMQGQLMKALGISDFTDFCIADNLTQAWVDASGSTEAKEARARYVTALNKFYAYDGFRNAIMIAKSNYTNNFYKDNTGRTAGVTELMSSMQTLETGDVSESGTVSAGVANIKKLLTLQENGSAILKTQSMIDNKTNDISQATENWRLLVEPIVYLTICNGGSSGLPADKASTSKLYGTVTNVIQAMKEGVAGTKHITGKDFNWKMFREAWCALKVDSEYEFGNKYKFTTLESASLHEGEWYSPEKLTQSWTAAGVAEDGTPIMTKTGWGVNIYWDSNGSVEGRTWDEPTPYPAAPPASQKVKENGIPVVKWYVTLFTDNTTNTTKEIVTNVIVDHDHPRKILAENEGNPDEGSFYLLEKWATGTKSTLPANGDTSTTFEEYHAKNPGQIAGLEPAIVEVPDSDQVLYLKLVDTGWIDPTEGDITVIKVKEPSSGDPIIEQDTASGDSYDPTEKDAESCAVCVLPFAARKKSVLNVIELVMKGNAFITSLFNHGVY